MANEKLLIIDDEENTLQLLKIIFEKHGYNIIAVQNGDDINNKINKIKPDLILLDILIPKKDGIQILQEIKKNPENSSIPIIVLTSYKDFDTRLNALRKGAVDYITKPFHKEELLYRVRNIIDNISRKKVESSNDKNALINSLVKNGYKILKPGIDKNSKFGYSYPDVLHTTSIQEQLKQLENLVKQGALKPVAAESIHLCPKCEHYNLNFYERCPYCYNKIEYEEESESWKCTYCGRYTSRPVLNFKCLNCGHKCELQELIRRELYHYEVITNKKKQVLKADLIVQALSESGISYVKFEDFNNKLSQEITIAAESDYPLTVMSIEVVDSQNINLKLLKRVLSFIKKSLRKFDVVGYKANAIILLCLPKIHLNMAKIFAEKIKNVSPGIELKIKLASYPEDGYNEAEILTMLEMGIETVQDRFTP